MPSPPPEIDDLYAAWSDAFRRRDLDAILALLAPDYVMWAPGLPPLAGPAALRPMLANAFDTYDISPAFERSELLFDGDLAVDFGWDVQTVTPRAGGEPMTQRQRVVLVLRRQPPAQWLFARGMSHPGPAATND